MHYLPNEPLMDEMLRDLGLTSVDDLFSDIPAGLRSDLPLPPGRCEFEVLSDLRELAAMNRTAERRSFLGGGLYRHYVPPAVDGVASRSEFLTAYTPYQPEISQGILQALFEYQSLVAELTGLPVVNASLYDASTALAEAVLTAFRHNGRRRVLLPQAMHPDRKAVVRTYAKGHGLTIEEVPFDTVHGGIDLGELERRIDDDVAAVYLENPGYLGNFDPGAVHVKGMLPDETLYVVGVHPLSLGIAEAPGAYGADIVVGEGQALGTPLSYGGPLLGLFATTTTLMRRIPGRLIGMTRDAHGERGFCMTLQTREQHIRRARATSNICSNEAWLAIRAAAYLSLLGPRGLEDLGRLLVGRARRLREGLRSAGAACPFAGFPFNEVLVDLAVPAAEARSRLSKEGFQAPTPVRLPGFERRGLLAVSEATDEGEIDALVRAMARTGVIP